MSFRSRRFFNAAAFAGGSGGPSGSGLAAGVGGAIAVGAATAASVGASAGVGAAAGVAPGGGGVAFDPSNEFGVTLTNSNLTAKNTSASPAFGNVRTTTSHTTGKYYAEFIIDAVDALSLMDVGVVNGSFAFPDAQHFVGGSNNGVAIANNNGGSYTTSYVINGSFAALALLTDPWIATHRICMATDLTNGVIWWRYDNGLWNATTFSAGTSGDPTNCLSTGAIPLNALGTPGSTAIYLAVEVETSGEQFTACFASGSWSFTPPTGFIQW